MKSYSEEHGYANGPKVHYLFSKARCGTELHGTWSAHWLLIGNTLSLSVPSCVPMLYGGGDVYVYYVLLQAYANHVLLLLCS